MRTATGEQAVVMDRLRNYPVNLWWVAARSDEVGQTPMQRWLLERPVVLYRTSSGQAVALEDRCMHRWAPLSAGYVDGDELVCGYHGAVFASDGKCVRYPGETAVPRKAAVQCYPTIENDPFIWIWLGDPEKIKEAEPPPIFPWFRDPEWLVASGEMPFEANYFWLQENVLDLTHFNYAHRKSFGETNQPVPSAYHRDGNKVYFELEQEDCAIPQWRRKAMRLDGRTVSRHLRAVFESPAYHRIRMQFKIQDAKPGERSAYDSWVIHCVTPESPTKTHYWWINAQDLGSRPPEIVEQLTQDVNAAFDEDKTILENIQSMVLRDPRHLDSNEVSFRGDLGGIHARRVLKEMLAAERETQKESREPSVQA